MGLAYEGEGSHKWLCGGQGQRTVPRKGEVPGGVGGDDGDWGVKTPTVGGKCGENDATGRKKTKNPGLGDTTPRDKINDRRERLLRDGKEKRGGRGNRSTMEGKGGPCLCTCRKGGKTCSGRGQKKGKKRGRGTGPRNSAQGSPRSFVVKKKSLQDSLGREGERRQHRAGKKKAEDSNQCRKNVKCRANGVKRVAVKGNTHHETNGQKPMGVEKLTGRGGEKHKLNKQISSSKAPDVG